MVSFCTDCGSSIKPGDRFCGSCGKPSMRVEAGHAPTAIVAAPGAHAMPVAHQAPYAPPAHAYAPPVYGPPIYVEGQKTNGFAIASLVLGIVWIYWVGSLLAVIFGAVAISQIRASQGRQSGDGMAIAGLVLGIVGLAILFVLLIIGAAVA
jgi:hypothetical protein